MLMELAAEIKKRVDATKAWIEDYDAEMKRDGQPIDSKSRAILVIVMDARISSWLAEHDPNALEQAQKAMNGKSWNDFIMSH